LLKIRRVPEKQARGSALLKVRMRPVPKATTVLGRL